MQDSSATNCVTIQPSVMHNLHLKTIDLLRFCILTIALCTSILADVAKEVILLDISSRNEVMVQIKITNFCFSLSGLL